MSNGSDLKREIDRLTFDLQQACQEKVQAAEYGLAVLEEKQQLQEKYDDLEIAFEKGKHELTQATEQISILRSKYDDLAQKIDHKQGNIVQECSTRESAFATRVSELQVDVKNLKKAERAASRDCETLKHQLASLQKSHETTCEEKKQLSQDIKDRKLRESQFNDEYNALEEENTYLQKTVSKLKQTLVEYEGLKVENKSLLDEVDSYQLQLQVTTATRDQFEKQLHEALDSVKEQRERHAQYQKEIHELKQQSIMKTWNMELKEFSENPIIKQITEELRDTPTPTPASGLVDDLLKELQFTEMRELEEQLRVVNEEKQDLAKQLAKKKATATSNGHESVSDANESDEHTSSKAANELIELKEAYKQVCNRETFHQMEMKRLSEEIDELKELHKGVEDEKNALLENSKGKSKNLSDELLSLKSKLRDSQSSIKSLESEVSMLKEIAGESQGSLNCTLDELKSVYSDLMKSNKTICEKSDESKDIDACRASGNKSPSRGTPELCFKLMTRVKEQLRILQLNVNKLVCEKTQHIMPAHVNDQARENMQLKEQLLKLQSLVATKREQISTLRTVLKANKSTYEVALANLKSRYENDKDIQAETNSQLKRQIKALKSECLTFTSMRSMFAARCDDYMKQLLDKEQTIKAAEEEKRTLNNLLKTAIQQKIAVKQKLEEFEIARERLREFTKKNIKPSGKENAKIVTPAKPVTRV